MLGKLSKNERVTKMERVKRQWHLLTRLTITIISVILVTFSAFQ